MFSYIHIISVNGVDHHMAEFDLLTMKLTHTHILTKKQSCDQGTLCNS